MVLLDNFVGALLLFYVIIIIWSKILDKSINYKNYKFYLTLIVLAIVSIVNYYLTNQFIKLLTISVFMAIASIYLFKVTIRESIILIIITQMVVMISDALTAIFFTSVYGGVSYAENVRFSKIYVNIIASVFLLILRLIIPLTKIYRYILNFNQQIKQREILFLSIFSMLFTNIMTFLLYNNVDFRILIIGNLLYSIFCFVIIIYTFKTKNNYIKVSDKYNTTLNSLKEYEEILDRYRVSNHENKNQLLTIRNMLPKTNKKAINYIDIIIENKLKDNEKLMFETSKIPAGGLRGLIYSKILYMKENSIDYDLNIARNLRTVDLINKIDDMTMLDVCKILGVYFDNAIQAVESNQEKYISIDMYLDDDDLVLSILNTYSGKIDIDKLEDAGYTTKSAGHGYGLSLAKELIENNKLLANEKLIQKNSFTQILKIKM